MKDPAARKPKTGSLFEQKHVDPRLYKIYVENAAIICIDDQNHIDCINQELRPV